MQVESLGAYTSSILRHACNVLAAVNTEDNTFGFLVMAACITHRAVQRGSCSRLLTKTQLCQPKEKFWRGGSYCSVYFWAMLPSNNTPCSMPWEKKEHLHPVFLLTLCCFSGIFLFVNKGSQTQIPPLDSACGLRCTCAAQPLLQA